jgi:hypothetical protein
MDFDWPLNKVWEGYLNPYYGKKCPICGGHGQNEATRQIEKEWYAFDNPKWVYSNASRTQRYNDNAHQYHLTQVEVNALLASNRLHALKRKLGRDPTVNEVNEWAIYDPFGHDGVNCWICVEARAKDLGVYGLCPTCGGEDFVWNSLEDKKKYETWEPQEPPTGPGFQLWETTTEGSPQSPVFATLDELSKWCENNATTFGDSKASKEEWAKMLAEDNVHFSEGRFTYV